MPGRSRRRRRHAMPCTCARRRRSPVAFDPRPANMISRFAYSLLTASTLRPRREEPPMPDSCRRRLMPGWLHGAARVVLRRRSTGPDARIALESLYLTPGLAPYDAMVDHGQVSPGAARRAVVAGGAVGPASGSPYQCRPHLVANAARARWPRRPPGSRATGERKRGEACSKSVGAIQPVVPPGIAVTGQRRLRPPCRPHPVTIVGRGRSDASPQWKPAPGERKPAAARENR